jgi:hypothetical protein
VNASQPWTATNVELRRGQEVYFGAGGQVLRVRDRKAGPAGERNSPRNPGRPIPNRPGAALIGRIDDGGPLYLGVNDDYLLDNSGEFRVTVYYRGCGDARRGSRRAAEHVELDAEGVRISSRVARSGSSPRAA